MLFHLSPSSGNAKTGPIAVSTTSRESCPDTCPLKAKGCYASSGHVNIHWKAVTEGKRGVSFADFLLQIAALPKGHKFRHNQAGDLPGVNNRINAKELDSLASVVKKRALQAWTYTHKPATPANLKAIRAANDKGFTVNLSADNLSEADELKKTGLPVVVILPIDAPNMVYTPEGNKVIVCPATRKGKNTTCADCMLCYKQRSVIIGFPAHGIAKKHVEQVATSN